MESTVLMGDKMLRILVPPYWRQTRLVYDLVSNFFHPYPTYTPLLPIDFAGTFSIELDPRLIYTYKSQHLKSVTLRGSNDANLTENTYNNVLTGNSGNNMLRRWQRGRPALW